MSTHTRLSRSIAALLALIGLLTALSGTALATPNREPTAQTDLPPYSGRRAFLVILDASTSMSWTWDGRGTKEGVDVQCGPASDPAIQRVRCGPAAAWRVEQERRVYDVKNALQPLIDQLGPNDTMRLLSFSTTAITANERWTLGDPAGKATLTEDLLELGQYRHDPYRTAGEAPTASALYRARQLLDQQPQTAPDGQEYGPPFVILLTDSVANSFLVGDGDWEFNKATDVCRNVPFPEDVVQCQIGFTSSGLARPLTAMAQQGQILQQRNAIIYVMALAGVDEAGLRDIASTPSYPFFSVAGNADELEASISDIIFDTAPPFEGVLP